MNENTVRRRRNEAKARRNRMYTRISQIFIVTIAGILLLNLLVPSRDYSANENRSLSGRPKLTASTVANGKYFQDFNTYYSDQFVGRDLWMNLKTLGVTLLGNKETNGILFGEDGYLLQYPTTPDDSAVQNTAAAINTFAKNHSDLNQTMIVVPDAASVLTDKLPSNAPVRNQVQDIRKFTAQLNDEIRVLDTESVLKTAAEQDQVFYRTDHHWTSFGAYSVFRGAASLLGINASMEYQAVTVSDSFRGTLASRTGKNSRADQVQIYEPQSEDVSYIVNYPDSGESSATMYVSEALNEKDHYQVFFGGNHPLVEIRTTADNQRSLLIFKDSYANSFIQFLTPYFEKIIIIDPRYYYENLNTTMTSYGITDVLYLYSADTLLTDTGLADVLATGTDTDSEETAVTDNGSTDIAEEDNGEADTAEEVVSQS